MKNQEVEVTSWYDRPEWFEIGFHNETKKEADFFEAAFKKYCSFPVKRLLEPACGSGRIVTEMAARGYDVTGFDLSEPSLEVFAPAAEKTPAEGDGAERRHDEIQTARQVRLGVLHVQQFPRAHNRNGGQQPFKVRGRRRAVGGPVLPGNASCPAGLRSDVHRTLDRPARQYSRDHHAADCRLRFESPHRTAAHQFARRGEFEKNGKASNGAPRNGKTLLSKRPAKMYRLRDEFDYRTDTAAQIKKLIASIGKWDRRRVRFLVRTDEPQELDDDQVDTLFVLQRR